MDDGHTFLWHPVHGAWLFLKGGGRIKFDIIGRVPHFPSRNPRAMREWLISQGFEDRLKTLGSKSEEELRELVREFSAMAGVIKEAIGDMPVAQIPEFLKTPKRQSVYVMSGNLGSFPGPAR